MHQVFNQVKNDLTEVGKIGDLSNAAVLGMIAEKLPGDPCKTRWIRYQAVEEIARPEATSMDLFCDWMDQERRTQKALAKIEGENKAKPELPRPEGGVTETRSCLTCGTVGHL